MPTLWTPESTLYAEFSEDAPAVFTSYRKLLDNIRAAFEGAADAPRLARGAFGGLESDAVITNNGIEVARRIVTAEIEFTALTCSLTVAGSLWLRVRNIDSGAREAQTSFFKNGSFVNGQSGTLSVGQSHSYRFTGLVAGDLVSVAVAHPGSFAPMTAMAEMLISNPTSRYSAS